MRETRPAARRRGRDPAPRRPAPRAVVLFDIYRGRPLGDDEKSLAFRLAFQAADRTLTEAEVDGAIEAVTPRPCR